MDPLGEAFQHHTWATEKLIRHLRGLKPAALTASAAGVYGSPIATLSHLLAADNRYLSWLDGTPLPSREYGPDPARTLDQLADAVRDQAVRWRVVLPQMNEIDLTVPGRSDRPDLPHATNLAVVQALHHGNDHRTQVCTVLSVNGFETPDLDVWSYWRERRAQKAG
jgi:uncharacterized damage-inducible protein DinB